MFESPKKLDYPDEIKLSGGDYMKAVEDHFEDQIDFQKSPISLYLIRLKNGIEYMWANSGAWASTQSNLIILEKVEP